MSEYKTITQLENKVTGIQILNKMLSDESVTVNTLGSRGFSCAVSGFIQVLKSDLRVSSRARVLGLWPTKLLVTRKKKPLVPRVNSK